MLLTIEMINIIYKGDIQSNKIVKKKLKNKKPIPHTKSF